MRVISKIDNDTVYYATEFSAGFDIPIAEDVTLDFDKVHMVSTGLYLEVEQKDYEVWADSGYVPYLQIVPRSGVSLKGIGIANAPATIDMDYEGEIKLLLYSKMGKRIHLDKGFRAAQGIFQMAYRPAQMNILYNKRGAGGFGSTGER